MLTSSTKPNSKRALVLRSRWRSSAPATKHDSIKVMNNFITYLLLRNQRLYPTRQHRAALVEHNTEHRQVLHVVKCTTDTTDRSNSLADDNAAGCTKRG